MYDGAKIFPIDRAIAQRWFRAAAELGQPCAIASGAAGKLNPVEARLWLERAIAQGVPDAEADLAELTAPAKQQ